MAGLRQAGQAPLAEALKNVFAGCGLPPQNRQEMIENLAFVGQQAQLVPEKRKRGVLRAALAYVKHTMQASEALNDAWLTFGHTVENFFHL